MGLIAGTHILRKINRASRRIVTSLCFVSLILGTAHAAQLTATWVDNSDNEKDFKLERKTGTTGNYQLLASVPADTPFYVDTTVTAGTTYCYRVRAKNDAGESANSNEACAVAANTILRALTVAKAGTGTGTVASSPAGINCGATCSASFTSGTSVGLSATAATGSTFTGWSGACTGTGGCAVVLDAAKSVTATFAVGAQATTTLTMSSVTAAQASPVVAGTALTLTATATGGTAPYQFKWWVWNGSAWSVAREWAPGNTLRWTPTAPGDYEVHAWVRNNGVTADAWQAWGRLTYTVTAAPTASLSSMSTTVTATQASPVVAGTPLTLTATATGGTAPYQFKWWVWNGSAWSVARDWGTGNTLPWTPPAPGTYEVHAWVRNNGVTADTWQAWGRLVYTVTDAPAPTMASVTANRTGIRPVGRSVTLTATATGGTAPYQFKWWVWNGSAWSVAQEWAPGNTLRWTPTAPGDYEVHAWVRNNGVTADAWQAWGRLSYTVR